MQLITHLYHNGFPYANILICVTNLAMLVLEAAKLAYANKTKESVTSQKLGSRDFW